MIFSKRFKESKQLEDQNNFATIGATILDNFGFSMPNNSIGTSIIKSNFYKICYTCFTEDKNSKWKENHENSIFDTLYEKKL